MIDSKEAFKEYVVIEEKQYREIGYKGKLHALVTQCEVGKIVQFMKVLRKDELYTNTYGSSILRKCLALYYRRKHNILGLKLGISIPVNTFGKGLLIYHSQSIIVHKDARCGEYCKLHGCNCIGNNGKEYADPTTPVLGNHIDIGIGAKIIGGITIADDSKVAAGAIVCKSFERKGCVLFGIPAIEMK